MTGTPTDHHHDAVRDIMGMFILAFGRGVPTGIHVRREVVAAIYTVLEPSVRRAIGAGKGGWDEIWRSESNTVLALMEAVGAYASFLTMTQGLTVVDAKQFTDAFASVKAERQGPAAGRWCA
jgi:hypothetical protein